MKENAIDDVRSPPVATNVPNVATRIIFGVSQTVKVEKA